MNWDKLLVLIVFIFVSLIVSAFVFGLAYLVFSLGHVILLTKTEACFAIAGFIFGETLWKLKKYL